MSGNWKPFVISSDTLTPGLKKYFAKAFNATRSSADFHARQIVGLQLLNFALNGSSGDPTVPPIRWGVLRGSGSVFVDGTLVGDTKSSYPDGTPNAQYSAEAGDVTIGFNTAYAARLHETNWVPGGKVPSKQVQRNPGILGNVGNKWVERHLKADKDVLVALYASTFKRDMES